MPTETPAYDVLTSLLHGQAATLGDALSGEGGGEPDPDPNSGVLNAISNGNSLASDHEHVSTLASFGYSVETVAEALDTTVEDVESLAEERLRSLMHGFTDPTRFPDEDVLWKLHYIINEEQYAHFLNIVGVKDVAEQLKWTPLVDWIEASIEQGDGTHDYKLWVATVEETDTLHAD